MANNRMQIYCKKCLEAVVIAKYFPLSWYMQNNEDHFNEFFEKHNACFINGKEDHDEQWGTEMYGFRTENDDDGYMTAFEPYRIYIEKKRMLIGVCAKCFTPIYTNESMASILLPHECKAKSLDSSI